MKYTNVPSYSTAISVGMKKVKEYPDAENGITCVYAISKEEWLSGGLFSQQHTTTLS